MPWRPFGKLSKTELAEARREGKRKTRFLMDESVDNRVASLLRSAGYNAVYAEAAGLKGHPDENVFAFAKRENRVLITHDPDFLDDRRFSPQQNPGLIVIPGAEGNRRLILDCINAILLIVGHQRDLCGQRWGESGAKVGHPGRKSGIPETQNATWTPRQYGGSVPATGW